MVTKLPVVKYKGSYYFVDFRLGELRSVKSAAPLKFVSMRENKNSPIKKKLRALRFRTWHNEYVPGIDD